VVGDAEEAVGVGRHIDAADVGTLVHHDVDETGVLVGEAVVVLPPHGRGDQQVERGDGGAPSELAADREPLGVLVEHRVDHVGERLVGGEEPVPAGEEVAFEPAFEGVLGEHLEDAAVGGELAAVGILREVVGEPELLGRPVHVVELVRCGFIGAEDAEGGRVPPHDVAQEAAERARVLGGGLPGVIDCDAVISKVRDAEGLSEQAAVGMGVGAHPPGAQGRQRLEFRHEAAGLVEQVLGLIAAQPVLELPQVRRVLVDAGQRHLVGAPRALDRMAVDRLRPGPTLGRAQHDHRPAGARRGDAAAAPRLLLDAPDFPDALLQRRRHLLVHVGRVAPLDEVG
jgi:hypothetical protein